MAKLFKRNYLQLPRDFYAIYNKEQKDLEEALLDIDTDIDIDVEYAPLNNDLIAAIEECKAPVAELKKAAEDAEKENLYSTQILINTFSVAHAK